LWFTFTNLRRDLGAPLFEHARSEIQSQSLRDENSYMRTMENQTAQHPETSLDRQETDVGDVVTCHSLDHPNTGVVEKRWKMGDVHGIFMVF
jgi:hypothetical protein